MKMYAWCDTLEDAAAKSEEAEKKHRHVEVVDRTTNSVVHYSLLTQTLMRRAVIKTEFELNAPVGESITGRALGRRDAHPARYMREDDQDYKYAVDLFESYKNIRRVAERLIK